MKLLETVEDIEPLGANMWAPSYNLYKFWAISTGYPERYIDSIKQKFDRLANTNKSTVDPNCPAMVRRAKAIAKPILCRAQAQILGTNNSDDDSG